MCVYDISPIEAAAITESQAVVCSRRFEGIRSEVWQEKLL